MCLSISDNANPNYLARIVELESVSVHPNADKLQVAEVLNTKVVVGLEAKKGDTFLLSLSSQKGFYGGQTLFQIVR